MTTPQLRCPWCNAPGINYVGAYPVKQVAVTYCRKCGAIRGAIFLFGSSISRRENVVLRCPWCNVFGLDQINITQAGQGIAVISCQGCGVIHGVVPITEPKSVESPKPVSPGTVTILPNPFVNKKLLDEVGNADFDIKRAQYEMEIAKRAMLAKQAGTLYLTIAQDNGPPYCLKCRRDMEEQIIPLGYKNSGKKVWVCPNQCGTWEAI